MSSLSSSQISINCHCLCHCWRRAVVIGCHCWPITHHNQSHKTAQNTTPQTSARDARAEKILIYIHRNCLALAVFFVVQNKRALTGLFYGTEGVYVWPYLGGSTVRREVVIFILRCRYMFGHIRCDNCSHEYMTTLSSL